MHQELTQQTQAEELNPHEHEEHREEE